MSPTLREAVAQGLRRVLDFQGCDTRSEYWPYVGAVLVSWFVLSNAILVPVMLIATSADVDPAELLAAVLSVMAVLGIAVVALVAAATTRRLHDRALRGWWAMVPAALLGSGLAIFGAVMGSGDEPDVTLFAAGFINNLLYFASLIALIVQLVQPGKPGGNRFDASM